MALPSPAQTVALATLVAAGVWSCRAAPAAPAPAPSAPGVLLRLRPRVGSVRRFIVTTSVHLKMDSSQGFALPDSQPFIRMEQVLTDSVTAVDADTVSVVAVVDSVRMHSLFRVPTSGMVDRLTGGLTVIKRQTDRGRILSRSVLVPPALAQFMDSSRKLAPGLASAMDPGGVHLPTVQYPERPVPVGGGWTDTMAMTGLIAGSTVTTFRLEREEARRGHRLAVISADAQSSGLAVQGSPAMSVQRVHGILKMWLDLDTGWIVRLMDTTDMVGQSQLGGVTMKVVVEMAPVDTISAHPAAASATDSGIGLFLSNHLERAAEVLAQAVREDTTDARALAYLADARRRRDDVPGSIEAARQALRHSTCSSFAHTVLAQDFDPRYGEHALTSLDSTWVHELAAVQCDSSDGNAWLVLHIEAMRRDDTMLEARALRRMVEGGFLSPGALAYAGWVLGSLPPRAVLLTSGDLDTYPALAAQQVQGRRADAAVISTSLLNLPWYARLVGDRFGLPLPPSDSALRAFEAAGKLSDTLVAMWREADLRGTLGRPLAFAQTLSVSGIQATWPGGYRWPGPYLVPAAGDSLTVDTAAMHGALRTAPTRVLAGSMWGAGDPSPVRRLQGPAADQVVYDWASYVDALARGGHAAAARDALKEAEAYMVEAGVRDLYSLRVLAVMREEVSRLP